MPQIYAVIEEEHQRHIEHFKSNDITCPCMQSRWIAKSLVVLDKPLLHRKGAFEEDLKFFYGNESWKGDIVLDGALSEYLVQFYLIVFITCQMLTQSLTLLLQ